MRARYQILADRADRVLRAVGLTLGPFLDHQDKPSPLGGPNWPLYRASGSPAAWKGPVLFLNRARTVGWIDDGASVARYAIYPDPAPGVRP